MLKLRHYRKTLVIIRATHEWHKLWRNIICQKYYLKNVIFTGKAFL